MMETEAIGGRAGILADPAAAYWRPASAEISRVVSLVDRETWSRTSGCFDRVHWCWKFTDFPGARFQEGLFTLAWLYTTPMSGPYYENPRLLEWLQSGLSFWQSIQYPDGSFDEAYPYEHSLAATAFTTFYVGEAYLRVHDRLDDGLKEGLVGCFQNAGAWLCRNDERHGVLSNHLAAAAAGLHNIGRITGDRRCFARSEFFLDRILSKQSPEGWYEEYGGADPGYQTHATFYLAWLWEQTGSDDLLDSLERAVDFQRFAVHPNGTIGGEYGSRGTEFYYPAGFEILASRISSAAAIADALRLASTNQTIAGPAAMDSYNLFPLLNNYLFAAEAAGSLPLSAPLPHETCGRWTFPDAGIHFASTDSYYAIVSASKGGVVRVYDKETGDLALSDCGYWARKGRSVISSQSLKRPAEVHVSEDEVVISADFASVNQKVLRPATFILFRLFTVTLGRWQKVAYAVKQLLVRVLVSRRKTHPLKLHRRVVLEADSVSIADRIVPDGPTQIDGCTSTPKFLTIHMGSSRYFQAQELDLPGDTPVMEAPDLLRRGIPCERKVVWKPGQSREVV